MKFIKILIINIFIIFVIILGIDYAVFYKYYCANVHEFSNKNPFDFYKQSYKSGYSPQTIQGLKGFGIFNPHFIDENNYKKGAILFFGCSYTYGFGLENNETIEYIIHAKTKRNVLNFGICATGIQHILYLLQNEELYKFINDKLSVLPASANQPELAIYTYIPSHLARQRLKMYPSAFLENGRNVLYVKKDGKLELSKPLLPAFFYKTYIIKAICYNHDIQINSMDNREKDFELFNSTILEIRRLLLEHYPNIKFIILRFRMEEDGEEDELPYMWETLRNEGFTILDTQEMIGRKFKYNTKDTAADGYHPSYSAWSLLAPKLIEELKL